MRTTLVILLIAALFCGGAFIAFKAVKAQSTPSISGEEARTQAQIESMLRQFLAGVESPEAHDRFWSDDLVYTSAAGVVRTKAEIMKSVRGGAGKAGDPQEPKTTYEAQDIKVKDYGNFAVLNFHLVAHTEKGGKPETMDFRNTGALRKENGQWKAIAWQATKIAPPE
jgi:ketosteroid isomerase-like protein